MAHPAAEFRDKLEVPRNHAYDAVKDAVRVAGAFAAATVRAMDPALQAYDPTVPFPRGKAKGETVLANWCVGAAVVDPARGGEVPVHLGNATKKGTESAWLILFLMNKAAGGGPARALGRVFDASLNAEASACGYPHGSVEALAKVAADFKVEYTLAGIPADSRPEAMGAIAGWLKYLYVAAGRALFARAFSDKPGLVFLQAADLKATLASVCAAAGADYPCDIIREFDALVAANTTQVPKKHRGEAGPSAPTPPAAAPPGAPAAQPIDAADAPGTTPPKYAAVLAESNPPVSA